MASGEIDLCVPTPVKKGTAATLAHMPTEWIVSFNQLDAWFYFFAVMKWYLIDDIEVMPECLPKIKLEYYILTIHYQDSITIIFKEKMVKILFNKN